MTQADSAVKRPMQDIVLHGKLSGLHQSQSRKLSAHIFATTPNMAHGWWILDHLSQRQSRMPGAHIFTTMPNTAQGRQIQNHLNQPQSRIHPIWHKAGQKKSCKMTSIARKNRNHEYLFFSTSTQLWKEKECASVILCIPDEGSRITSWWLEERNVTQDKLWWQCHNWSTDCWLNLDMTYSGLSLHVSSTIIQC